MHGIGNVATRHEAHAAAASNSKLRWLMVGWRFDRYQLHNDA